MEANGTIRMSERLNQLVDLSKMRDSGTITEEEFAQLKAELMTSPEPEEVDNEAPTEPSPTLWARAKQVAVDYPRVVGIAAGVAIVLMLALVYMSGTSGNPETNAVAPTTPDGPQAPSLPEDSLGIYFPDLPRLWNELDQSPWVEGGIARSLETGPFDSFLYRFDDSAVLAGAYDPADDAVYALMVRASLTHSDISNMYLHVCYLLHPFSQECIDAYWKEGLKGGELGDYLEEDHFSTWSFLGNEWRIEIVDGVQTLRVIGPGASRVAS